ncbi:MAG TPA: hypothetical protein VNO82_02750 [Solirubrobacteraceae bacterium]|nr:hypothetical protein [Solirubrobacteraceae bacterium]
MRVDDEVAAASAARDELGAGYDAAVARSLLERIDGRRRRSDLVTVVIALVSMGLGVTFALVAERLGDLGGTIATVVAWAAIVAVNLAHARRSSSCA